MSSMPEKGEQGKRTPGPWTVRTTDIKGLPTAHFVLDRNRGIIAQLGNVAEARANANLIAAAPDLLAACRAALADLDTWHNERISGYDSVGQPIPQTCDGCETCQTTVPLLQRVIAKAEGRDV